MPFFNSLHRPSPSAFSCKPSTRFGMIGNALHGLVLLALCGLCALPNQSVADGNNHRNWVGPDFWANRLQDWRIQHGRFECHRPLPMRTLHLLTHRLNEQGADFSLSAHIELNPEAKAKVDRPPQPGSEKKATPVTPHPQASCGFLVGAGASLDVRAAALIHHSPGPHAGIYAGVDQQGRLFFRDFSNQNKVLKLGKPAKMTTRLELQGTRVGDTIELKIISRYDQLSITLPAKRLLGNVALVAHNAQALFNDFQAEGDRFTIRLEDRCGPLISSMYTLSGGTLKLTSQFMPRGASDPKMAILEGQTKADGTWEALAMARIRTPSFTATFRVEDWEATAAVPVRVRYGDQTAWKGTVRADPVDKPEFVIAGFTGNHNLARPGIGNGTFRYDTDNIWFPHTTLNARVVHHDPDLLFFSGDQVYEDRSPSFPDHENIMLDYLYKWYLFCWAYRDIMAERPCITIPDDHDVFQGNLWGEGGRKTDKDDKGGYVHPAEFVHMVEVTQCSHLPDPYDPEPLSQGIRSYFTSMTYGGIGFAILEDRKFKSGCSGRVDGKTRGRADHINDPAFDMKKADTPGLSLLGDRQLRFLEQWVEDWEGQRMKMSLSQTIFANMATHHGEDLFRLIADLDSNGWPQSGRNRALHVLRKGYAMHLAGDQHLASLVHHGIDQHNDASWSFCVPSIANFYPRGWKPDVEGTHRAPGQAAIFARHHDGFGNKVTVHAVTNPTQLTGISTGHKPAQLHDKMPGYGIVRFNKAKRLYTAECWPLHADPKTDPPYSGWPHTIHQLENNQQNPTGYLPTVSGSGEPVVHVSKDGETIYALRIAADFAPPVFEAGTYTLFVETDTAEIRYRNIRPGKKGERYFPIPK